MADIVTPALGESVSEATVARWTKKAGDKVKKDEVLVELETDKVNLEVSAPADGVLTQIVAPEGSTVNAGAKLGVVGAGDGAAAAPRGPRARSRQAGPQGRGRRACAAGPDPACARPGCRRCGDRGQDPGHGRIGVRGHGRRLVEEARRRG